MRPGCECRAQPGPTAAIRRARRGCCRGPGRPRLTRHGDLDYRADAAVVPRALRRRAPRQGRGRVRPGPVDLPRVRGPRAGAGRRALRAAGVGPGDRVAYLLPNVPEMLVAHFAVPLAGAVLVTINTRLSAEEVRYICDHSGSVLLVVDAAFASTVAPVVASLETVRTVVTVVDPHGPPPGDPIPGAITYADLLAGAASNDGWRHAAVDGRRRARHDLDQLHVGHHRAAQGRHVQPPRGVSQRAGRGAALGAHPRQRLPVDAADVPLQRLVHGVGAGRDRRHPGVPARGARRDDLAADRRRGGHPPQRRAHRRGHRPRLPAGPRAGPTASSSRPPRRRPARPRSRVPSGWASRSCTSTASPRPTVRTRCASGSAGGTGSSRSSGRGCGPGRASG